MPDLLLLLVILVAVTLPALPGSFGILHGRTASSFGSSAVRAAGSCDTSTRTPIGRGQSVRHFSLAQLDPGAKSVLPPDTS